MKYVSTRAASSATGRPFCDILLEGLAPDGGLYVPQTYPQVDAATLNEWRTLLADQGYAAAAAAVLALFIDDIPTADLRAMCERAYGPDRFDGFAGNPVGLSDLGGGVLLGHLSQGPTAAFKDMAMQLLGELFSYELERRDQTLTIVGATSGDTGSAAEHAMLGKDRISVFMLTPAGRMSPFQQAQMFSIDDPAIVNIAVEGGVFDDCQDLVKELNADAAFKAAHRIGAVNSMNWGRVVAQIVYYVALSLQATAPGEKVSFAVPSGNFGNICAGHIARSMGLPIADLILATNENNVLAEFFATGTYRIRGAAETQETSSPSMDISKASNFERFVADLLGRDGDRVATLFGDELRTEHAFDLAAEDAFATLRERYGFIAGSSTHADRIATIRAEHARSGVVIDPHTADGVHVARALLQAEDVAAPVIVLETALPVKFSATIVEALGTEVPRPERFVGIEDLPRQVVDLPNDVEALKALIVERATR